jgi:hypothetical protein
VEYLIRLPDIDPDDPESSVIQYARSLNSFNRIATNVSLTATALQRALAVTLRVEGLDGDGGGGIVSRLRGSDAVKTARRVVSPLVTASAEMENIARAGTLFERLFRSQIVDSIHEARALAKNGQGRGLKIK